MAEERSVSTLSESPKKLLIPHTLTVRELADLIGVRPVEVIKDLLRNGIMATINQALDFDTAAVVATDLGHDVEEAPKSPVLAGGMTKDAARGGLLPEEEALLRPRPSVVTIMGHVDHGKTSLLDAIRQTNVTAQEVGGITQHIGAYQVEIDGKKITFLDTPGHEAFTAMRARGAQATDTAVVVVAADDGVMPQTIEAINHAKAAQIPIIVAINKIDKPEADLERVKRQLAEHDLLIEEWGGNVICVPVSAKTKDGIVDLLENILLVAEMGELRANPQGGVKGLVVEAELDNTRGPMATVLVQEGTLRVTDVVVAGATWGRIKAMFNDQGKHIKRAEPSVPAKILGLGSVPVAGDIFTVVPDERTARSILQNRQRANEDTSPTPAVTLQDIFGKIQAGQIKELNVILKTDVQGSIEPIRSSLEKLGSETLRVKVIHAAPGTVTETDVMLAIASKGIIIGFSTHPEPGARKLAETERIEIRSYDVIYNLVEDIDKALKGMLEPTFVDVIEGHGEVRQIFRVGKREMVAGIYVTDGKASRGAQVRVLRQGRKLLESKVSSLKHFKDDVREMAAGYECGIGVEEINEFQIGDILEFYRKEQAS